MNARERAMLAHPAGKGIAESPEVAAARMDAEAIALANSHRPKSRIPAWMPGVGLGLFVYLTLAGIGSGGVLASGWLL